MAKKKSKIQKYFEFFYTKIKLFFNEKKFFNDGVRLKYLFDYKKNSDNLIVIFSSCTRKGVKARYNYVRTLKDVDDNKLFILDDFAEDKRGCYYLGHYPEYKVEKATYNLIEKIKNKVNAKKIIFCGSSKGGWACLNFGLKDFGVKNTIVCGAPQFYLGDYLKSFEVMFPFIKGNNNAEEVIEELNTHLLKTITDNEHKDTDIYIHYSDKEHTYKEHIEDLLSALKKEKYNVIEDAWHYEDHSEVAFYFPTFLHDTVKSLLENNNEKS